MLAIRDDKERYEDMREILFRGLDKRYNKADGHEYNVWRFGSLIEYDNGQASIVASADRYGRGMFTNEVIPKTVGQYTGLKDENGKRIFEGDVVEGEDHYNYRLLFNGTVGFKDGSFVIFGECITHYRWMDYSVEIIGNIHESEVKE